VLQTRTQTQGGSKRTDQARTHMVARVHGPPTPQDKFSVALPEFWFLFFFSSPSECRGFTRISEDSSEIAFLLVENYTLTAPSWFRLAREFLERSALQRFSVFLHLHRSGRVEAKKVGR
jgi:hypothetical protein